MQTVPHADRIHSDQLKLSPAASMVVVSASAVGSWALVYLIVTALF